MKRILIILAVLIVNSVFGQSEYNQLSWIYSYNHKQSLIHSIRAQAGSDIEVEVKQQKNGKITKYKRVYDDFGNLSLLGKYDNEGQLNLISENTFDENGKALFTKSYRKGELYKAVYFERNDKGKVTYLKRLNGKGKIKNAGEWEYNADGCLLSSRMFKNDTVEAKKIWTYEYYDKCDKKKSTITNAKGKVLKEWTYDCKQEGELLEKKKDITQVCKWEEVDDEFLTKVYQSFDEKGRIYKNISKYRKRDTAIVSSMSYNQDEELIYSATYDFDYERPIKRISYKNGKELYISEYSYEGRNLKSYTSTKKSKLNYKYTYSYNDEEQLIAYNVYRKNEELRRTAVFKYN